MQDSWARMVLSGMIHSVRSRESPLSFLSSLLSSVCLHVLSCQSISGVESTLGACLKGSYAGTQVKSIQELEDLKSAQWACSFCENGPKNCRNLQNAAAVVFSGRIREIWRKNPNLTKRPGILGARTFLSSESCVTTFDHRP